MAPRDRLLVLLVPVIWGLNFVIIDYGIDTVPPLLFLAIRFTFVWFPLALFVPRPKAPWRVVLAVGATMSLGQFSLLYLGLHLGMPAGLASLVLQVQVMFTIGIAWLVLGERTGRRQLVGVAIGAAGLVIVAVGRGTQAPLGPMLLVIAGAVAWSGGNVIARWAKVPSGLSLVVWSAPVVPLPCLALSLIFDGPHAVGHALAHFDLSALGSTAYTVIGASLIGYSVYNGMLSRYPAGTVVPYILLVPPVGMVSAWILLGETPGAVELVGAAVMMAGVATATVPRRAPTERRFAAGDTDGPPPESPPGAAYGVSSVAPLLDPRQLP